MLPWDGIKCNAEENVVSIRLTVYLKFVIMIERKGLVSCCSYDKGELTDGQNENDSDKPGRQTYRHKNTHTNMRTRAHILTKTPSSHRLSHTYEHTHTHTRIPP